MRVLRVAPEKFERAATLQIGPHRQVPRACRSHHDPGVMRLRRLIEHQEPRNTTIPEKKQLVQARGKLGGLPRCDPSQLDYRSQRPSAGEAWRGSRIRISCAMLAAGVA